MGLAAYRTNPARMAKDVEATSLLGVNEVVYWSLSAARKNKQVKAFIQQLCDRTHERKEKYAA